MNHTFPTFQHLINRAMMTEKKRTEMETESARLVTSVQEQQSPPFLRQFTQQFKQSHPQGYQQQNQRPHQP
jgi:hypothetical protein